MKQKIWEGNFQISKNNKTLFLKEHRNWKMNLNRSKHNMKVSKNFLLMKKKKSQESLFYKKKSSKATVINSNKKWALTRPNNRMNQKSYFQIINR